MSTAGGADINSALPGLAAILSDGEVLEITNYKKAFQETIIGRLIDREIDIGQIDSFLTPIDKWLIRNHFDIPKPNARGWGLALSGEFKDPVTLAMTDLKKYPRVSQVCTFECNGNSALTGNVMKKVSPFRLIYKGINYLNPLKWKDLFDFLNRGARNGMLSTAEFTGVRLLDVLKDHPLTGNARELVFQGLDKGYDTIKDYLTMRKIYYERSFKIGEITATDPILCTHMNGEPLAPVHGFPLRVVFPGYQGADQVKWLSGITAIPGHFRGHFMEHYYRNEATFHRGGKAVVITYPSKVQKVKSLVIRFVKKDNSLKVFGIAWCGKKPVKAVSVSNNGGDSWREAAFLHPPAPYHWTFWSCDFGTVPPGRYTFLPRAEDSYGNIQPLDRRKGVFYGNNAVVPATVLVP